MDESAHPTKPQAEPPTPEVAQLLRLLELQAAERGRQRALPTALQGASFRYGSLVLIILFALGSVVVMDWMISQLPKPVPAAQAAQAAQAAPQAGVPISVLRSGPSPAPAAAEKPPGKD